MDRSSSINNAEHQPRPTDDSSYRPGPIETHHHGFTLDEWDIPTMPLMAVDSVADNSLDFSIIDVPPIPSSNAADLDQFPGTYVSGYNQAFPLPSSLVASSYQLSPPNSEAGPGRVNRWTSAMRPPGPPRSHRTQRPSASQHRQQRREERRDRPRREPAVDRPVTFRMDRDEERLEYVTHLLEKLDKDLICKVLFHLVDELVPKRRSRFPYSKGGMVVNRAPVFWPEGIIWESAFHLRREVVLPLAAYLLRLHWSAEQWTAFNVGFANMPSECLGWPAMIGRVSAAAAHERQGSPSTTRYAAQARHLEELFRFVLAEYCLVREGTGALHYQSYVPGPSGSMSTAFGPYRDILIRPWQSTGSQSIPVRRGSQQSTPPTSNSASTTPSSTQFLPATPDCYPMDDAQASSQFPVWPVPRQFVPFQPIAVSSSAPGTSFMTPSDGLRNMPAYRNPELDAFATLMPQWDLVYDDERYNEDCGNDGRVHPDPQEPIEGPAM